MRRVTLGWIVMSIVGGAAACGAARLPAPSYVGQPTDALLEADYPPPPAHVEFVPAQPNGDAVWVDGEWTWQGRRWAWKPGRWLVPPANAKFSPWTSVRNKTGVLFVAEGKWRDEKGRELADPKPLAVGRTRGGSVVNAEGEDVPATPNVLPQDPPGGGGGGGGARSNEGDGGAPETPSGSTPTGTEPKAEPPEDAGLADAGSFRMTPR